MKGNIQNVKASKPEIDHGEVMAAPMLCYINSSLVVADSLALSSAICVSCAWEHADAALREALHKGQ